MAVSIEAAFVLLDKASGPLKEIRRQALLTDKALRGMGKEGGFSGATASIGSVKSMLDDARKSAKDMGNEVEKTGKKVKEAGNWFTRTFKSVRDWGKALVANNPLLRGTTAALGGVVGGLKGMASALPPLVWGILAAMPVIVALTGAIGALVSSLGAAVGGGALLGGGLIGSFAVGLGSIAAIAKPAIDAVGKYQKAVTALNTAIASGSPTAIRQRQKELDAIAKANPGVARLAGNLKAFQSEWKKATSAGRASFFTLANEGIQTMTKLLPTLASEANKNTASLQKSFQKILAPFLESSTFKGLVSGLGGIFRANLPGFMTGFVNIFKGLADALKVLTPQLDRAGPSFEKFTGKFATWAGSASGQNAIREMGRAFSAWLDLVKQIGRLLGGVVGAGMGPGTNEIGTWADKLSGVADKLSKPAGQNSLAGFFSRSLDDVNKLWPLMKSLVTDLTNLYEVFKPLGTVTQFVIKNLPAGVVTALTAGYLGLKGVTGAVKGATGVLDVLNKTRGSTPANPLYVADVTGGLGGPGGLKTKGGKLKKLLYGAEGSASLEELTGVMGAGAAGTVLALATAEGVLFPMSMDLLPKISGPQRPVAPRTASNPQGIGAAGTNTFDTLRNRFRPRRTASNPQAINPLITLGGTSGIHMLPASHFNPPAPALATGGEMHGAGVISGATGGFNLGAISTSISTFTRGLTAKLNTPLAKALEKASDDFNTMSKQAGGSLDDILATATSTSDDIRQKLPKDSADTNQAVAQNYAIAAGDVETSMHRHVIAVQTAMSQIAALMAKAFQALGIKSGAAKQLAGAGYSLSDVTGTISGAKASGLTSSASGSASTIGGGSYQYATGGRLPGRPRGDHLPLYSRGGKLMGIADGGELVVNRHTEAKADRFLASFGTRLSDLVSGETKPHFERGGRIPRFATGGVVGEVSSFFTNAGFNKAAIAGILGNAMQESSLNPNAPGGGMWQQISNFGQGTGGTLLNQMQMMLSQIGGLRAALNAAGSPGTAAQIFEQGFEKAGIPAMANRIRYAQAAFAGQLGAGLTGAAVGGGGIGGGGVAIPVLKPPTVAGSGAVVAYGQQVINRVTQAANRYLASMGGGAGGGGGAVPSGVAGVVQDPSGKPVAGWIEPILNWARAHGWRGSVTSGYRSLAEQTAIYNSGVRPAAVPGTSNHEGTVFPRGAVDVSDASQLSSVLGGGPYGSTLVWAGSKDPVHFSHPHGGSYALGGRVPWYGQGADFVANRPQVIGVGDRPGGERVTVTPKGAAGPGGVHIEIHKIEVHRKGDIQKIVDEELALLAASLEKHA